jgi:hypothetical protein
MKKYVNKSATLKVVEFEDGDAQFLMRGQSIVTDKKVKKIQEGIVVKDVVPTLPKKKTVKAEGAE